MKKILYSSVLFASLIIQNASALNHNHCFSLGLAGTVDLERKERDNITTLKLKSRPSATYEASVGYNLIKDLYTGFEVLRTQENKYKGKDSSTLPTSATFSVSNKLYATALVAQVGYDFHDFGIAKLFAKAGAGVASVESKYNLAASATLTPNPYSQKVKAHNTFAFASKVGLSFPIHSCLDLNTYYAYSNFGKTQRSLSSYTTPTTQRDAGRFAVERHAVGFGLTIGM
jgi:opacity protein-like surface antigen